MNIYYWINSDFWHSQNLQLHHNVLELAVLAWLLIIPMMAEKNSVLTYVVALLRVLCWHPYVYISIPALGKFYSQAHFPV